MDDTMQVEASTSLSQSRKRTADEVEDEASEDEQEDMISNTPSKRLRNRQGQAVSQEARRYNAQALLNNLAFTKLFVTANYHVYSPATSPVLLCVLWEHDSLLYRALCQTLPQLYQVAPTLQALALTANPAVRMGELERILPVHSMLDLRSEAVERLETFLNMSSQQADVVVLVNPAGECTWANDPALSVGTSVSGAIAETAMTDSWTVAGHKAGSHHQKYLRADMGLALTKHLRQMAPSEAMDQDP